MANLFLAKGASSSDRSDNKAIGELGDQACRLATQALIETVASNQFRVVTAVGYFARIHHNDAISHRQ